MWNINAPQGRIPCEIFFYKICRVSTAFKAALAVKISLDLLKGLWSYRGFKLTGSGYPQIFSAPIAATSETLCQTPNVLGVQERAQGLYHHAKFCGAQISPAAGWPKTLSFLVCLFVTLLNVRDCAPDLAMKALEYRKDFDAIG